MRMAVLLGQRTTGENLIIFFIFSTIIKYNNQVQVKQIIIQTMSLQYTCTPALSTEPYLHMVSFAADHLA